LENTVQDILKKSREWAGAQIEPALHGHSGSKMTAIAANALSSGVPELGAPELAQVRPRISASSWTGRRTASEQAVYVRELVPDAVASIDSLIAEQAAMRRHNHPPEALEDEQLAALRQLRDALTCLLDEVERDGEIGAAMERLGASVAGTFSIVRKTGRMCIDKIPAIGTTAIYAGGLYWVCSTLLGFAPELALIASTTVSGAAVNSKND
jgi:hypothetical protein